MEVTEIEEGNNFQAGSARNPAPLFPSFSSAPNVQAPKRPLFPVSISRNEIKFLERQCVMLRSEMQLSIIKGVEKCYLHANKIDLFL